MTAASLLTELKERGIKVLVQGQDLRLISSGRISDETVEQVKKLKPELLAHLSSRERPKAPFIAEPDQLVALEALLRALGAEVETPVGRGRLLYITQHGAVVQVANGLMYTLDPRKVKP
jgi:hypothetical protein